MAESPESAPEEQTAMLDEAPKDLTAESGLAPKPEQQAQMPPALPPVETAPPEKGFMDKVVAALGGAVATVGGALSTLSIDPMYMGIIGGAVLLLIILTILLVKRRKKTGKFQESILTGAAAGGAASEAQAAASSAAEPASLDTNFSEESSFLSDFAISGAGAIQAEDSEVDPLTEADVFMAYGRHEAAEERLNEAIKQDPNRKELKLKLLELYNTTRNREGFEPLAEEFYASLGDSASGDPMWEKVLIMGAEIAPDNPLFGNAPAAPASSSVEDDFSDVSNASLSDSQVMDIGLDTGVFQTGDFEAPAAGGKEEESSASLDFNLDFGEETSTAESSGDESTASMDFNLGDEAAGDESTASLDFNLGDDEETSTMGAPSIEAEEGEETASMDTKGMDFELDSGAEEPAAEPTMTMEAPDLESSDSGMSLDFDMGESADESTASLDFDIGDASAEMSAPAEESFSLDMDSGAEAADTGMDLNLDATDASAGMDEIGSVDEVGTKLDLAKAYIDMGDPEGARSILDEVMEEGNDTQKQEAQQLIQQIV
jgi:pilus assembly protein FimV